MIIVFRILSTKRQTPHSKPHESLWYPNPKATKKEHKTSLAIMESPSSVHSSAKDPEDHCFPDFVSQKTNS